MSESREQEYVGGDVAPADLWGAAPERGRAIDVVADVFDLHMVGHARPPAPFRIVDALIAAGLLPDETGQGRFRMENQPRAELVRRVRALHDEAAEVMQILAALDPDRFPLGDGLYCAADRHDTADYTPVSMAMRVAALVAQLREGKT
jgi:hypothetical protein